MLSSLPYFDETKSFPHDIMHLIHEGIANLELSLLLRKLIEEEDLDLDRVNFSISQIASQSQREFTVPPPIDLTR